MTLGEKLAGCRRQNNYTQEQLAELLGVSRQAISKWESDTAFPETDKLIKLSDMYGCSLDYLLKDKQPEPQPEQAQPARLSISFRDIQFERKSERTVRGVPLWHINIGFGRTAKGIFAFGLKAQGVFACGLLSMGVFSAGVLSLGLLAFGSFALGLLAFGAIAVGMVALGGVAVGMLAIGGAAVGLVSVGGAALAQYVAYGDSATAQVAIGFTEAFGSSLEMLGKQLRPEQITQAAMKIDEVVPGWLSWAADFVKSLLR